MGSLLIAVFAKALKLDQIGDFSMTDNTHLSYMALALQLAQQGRYTVSPNPMVACLIVKNKQIIGRGWHQRAGEAHAEVFALQEAGEQAREATVYVTLEPCCHVGRTPPCTAALIAAGIKEVYVACLDPNSLVAGKGIQALEAAGISVKLGLLEQEAKDLNEIFFHYMKCQRPFVLAKWAMSLDGMTITHPADSRQISSPESHRHTHEIRQQFDAILVGARTAISDNPQLTVRALGKDIADIKQPLRIVLSSQGSIPLDLKLFDGSLPGKTMLATTSSIDPAYCRLLAARQVEVVILPQAGKGQVSLPALLDHLGKKGVTSLLVEGGRQVHANFFNDNLVNKIQVYVAPTIIASLEKKKIVSKMNCCAMGQDFAFSANFKEV